MTKRSRWMWAVLAAVLTAGIISSFLIPTTPHIITGARRVMEITDTSGVDSVYDTFWVDEQTLLVIRGKAAYRRARVAVGETDQFRI